LIRLNATTAANVRWTDLNNKIRTQTQSLRQCLQTASKTKKVGWVLLTDLDEFTFSGIGAVALDKFCDDARINNCIVVERFQFGGNSVSHRTGFQTRDYDHRENESRFPGKLMINMNQAKQDPRLLSPKSMHSMGHGIQCPRLQIDILKTNHYIRSRATFLNRRKHPGRDVRDPATSFDRLNSFSNRIKDRSALMFAHLMEKNVACARGNSGLSCHFQSLWPEFACLH